VYKLYDRILSTCAEPTRAYLHLSIVAALADPLPLPQISTLLGPGQGFDVEAMLMQSVMDIPEDSTQPVNIYHSSIRDYVSDPSNCSLPEPHRLKALLSFLVRPPEPLSALIYILWLRGDRTSYLQFWLGTKDGYAWMQTTNG
jgi:hypothetical protein